MDYGSAGCGARRAGDEDYYYPLFHLDMLSVIGRPLRVLSRQGGFFDNVTFSLQHWASPYNSKHVTGSLPFDLQHRTFRLGVAASRELWFLVMHPAGGRICELPSSRAKDRRRKEDARRSSAMQRHHAEALASYITELFLQPDLVGEGVEPSWTLFRRQSKDLSYRKWLVFQELFVEQWRGFVEAHAHDEFWTDNEPAFHTYDYGANTDIEVSEQTCDRVAEPRVLRDDLDDDDSDNNPDSSDDRGESYDSQSDAASPRQGSDRLYAGGLRTLLKDLELKYEIAAVQQISYALAADINCARPPASGDRGGGAAVCLLSDRRMVAQQYDKQSHFTFYPLGFHPGFGNFSSSRPPRFLRDLCNILRQNMSVRNDGADVLSFGFFQGYSNIKRTIRSRPADFLATQGTATAALTLPYSEARVSTRTRDRQRQLLVKLHGDATPGQPDASIPFARERERIQASMNANQFAFRMEQVVTVKTSQLEPRRRKFSTALEPIFHLIRFFFRDRKLYQAVLYSFPPMIFPGILWSFARMFELAFGEMDGHFRRQGGAGLALAQAEGTALLDRLGHYCFTGDPRILPRVVLDPLITADSLRYGAWPFICPDMLDLRGSRGTINLHRWPGNAEDGPVLLHIPSLQFHYGPVVAASARGHIWFGLFASSRLRNRVAVFTFLEMLFRRQWIPQMMQFLAPQWRRHWSRAARARGLGGSPPDEDTQRWDRFDQELNAWLESEQPFGSKYARAPLVSTLGPSPLL